LDAAEFGDYVKRAVEHYGDKISHYDVWNEPWHPSFFPIDFVTKEPESLDRATNVGVRGSGWYINSDSAPEDYALLQKTAYETIQEIETNARVVGMNTHTHRGREGRFGGDIWSQRMAAADALETLDIVGYHQYSSGPLGPQDDIITTETEWTFAPFGGLKKLQDSGHPVWMTEGSPIARKNFSGFYNHSLPYQEDEDYWANSDRVVRYLVRLLSEGIEKIFLYSMDAWAGFGQQPARLRMFVNEDGFPHPTAAAASTITWHLEDAKFRKSFRLAGTSGTAYVFDSRDSVVAVLIPDPDTMIDVPKPADPSVKVEDIFGNAPDGKRSKTSIFLRGSGDQIESALNSLES
jgi:hypothetical protein